MLVGMMAYFFMYLGMPKVSGVESSDPPGLCGRIILHRPQLRLYDRAAQDSKGTRVIVAWHRSRVG